LSALATVGIAGAAGVLGSVIVAELARKKTLRFLPILRPGRTAEANALFCDLTNPEDCLAAARQCDLIVSAAGPSATVQPAIAAACAASGRPFLDVSALVCDLPPTKVPMVFGCGVMPGWSELLPAMMVRDMPPGADVRVTFEPGGALGQAGRSDYFDAVARHHARFGSALRHGLRVAASPAPDHIAYLSRESENLAYGARLGALLVETRRAACASVTLRVTVTSPEGEKKHACVSANSAAAYSVAALELCLGLLDANALPSGAIDLGRLDIRADDGFAALSCAGLKVTTSAPPAPAEIGFL
jgi:hypothetical protein